MQLPWTPQVSSSRPRASASAAVRDASSGAGSFVAAVGDELERQHRPDPAHVADRRESLLPLEHARPDRLADRRRALDEALLVDHVEDGERGRLATGLPT